jgi:hypothetical protein
MIEITNRLSRGLAGDLLGRSGYLKLGLVRFRPIRRKTRPARDS